jgi:hypothetical protein
MAPNPIAAHAATKTNAIAEHRSVQLVPQPKSFLHRGAKAQRNQLAMPFEFSAPLRLCVRKSWRENNKRVDIYEECREEHWDLELDCDLRPWSLRLAAHADRVTPPEVAATGHLRPENHPPRSMRDLNFQDF